MFGLKTASLGTGGSGGMTAEPPAPWEQLFESYYKMVLLLN